MSVLSPPSKLQWLYIDFNSYFASVEQQINPHLRGRPVIVVPVDTDATCAIAASYEAKAFGIKTNTPVYEAKRLCPGVICVVGQHVHYVEYHQKILHEVNQHIPVTRACSIDEFACRLLKNEAAPDIAADIARRIKDGIKRNVGAFVKCSIGIAPNKYLAKVATDMQKPNGLTILLPQDIPHRLNVLNLRDLPGIGHNMEARLHRLGVYTMPDLLRLAPKQMRQMWGNVWGEKLWLNLRGHDVPEEETGTKKSIGHSHVLNPEMRPASRAIDIARRLTLKAASRLRRHNLVCAAFILSMRIEKGQRLAIEARFQATSDSVILLEYLERMWQQNLQGHAANLRLKKVSVTFYKLCAPEQVQRDLFETEPTDQKKRQNGKLQAEIDRLNQKYGRDTVMIGALCRKKSQDMGTKVAFTRIPDKAEFRE